MTWPVFFAGLLSIATAARAGEPPRPKLIVLDLVAERGLDQGTVRLLNELLLTEFTRAGTYEVTGGSDLKTLLDHEQQRQLAGCSEASCLVELGGALGADFLAASNIGRIGDFYLINVKIVDVRIGKVVSRWTTQVEGVENKLMAAVRESVAAVARGKSSSTATTAPAITTADATSTPSGGLSVGISAWVAGGVAVLGAGLGGLFGGLARSELAYSPVDPRYADSKRNADSYALAANVSFGVAGAALIAAVVLIAFDWTDSSGGTTVAPAIVPAGQGMVVRF